MMRETRKTAANSDDDELAEINALFGRIRLSQSTGITLQQYQRLNQRLKFQICLNIVRHSVFVNPHGDLRDRANVRNVFFYQVLNKWSRYYEQSNATIAQKDVDLSDASAFVSCVEKMYLDVWPGMVIEPVFLQDLAL